MARVTTEAELFSIGGGCLELIARLLASLLRFLWRRFVHTVIRGRRVGILFYLSRGVDIQERFPDRVQPVLLAC
jgi:hypothetical protein